jgi:TonB-dependent receptor
MDSSVHSPRLCRRLTALVPSGRPPARLFASLLLALGLAAGAAAQTAGTGGIAGRVQNLGNAKYLDNVRLTLEGTTREAFTNVSGEFRFNDVPAGEVKVRAVYTGLDAAVQSVTVTAGQTAILNFDLTSLERYGEGATVKLDAFVVQSNREYEGNALATNEQRFSPNLKVVVAADAYGNINEGNPGEFLKYLPGITVDYVAADVRTVSVRGFPSNFTNVSWDGMRLTSSASGANNRIFEFEQVSINNVSRTEVLKEPMPENPADSLGGNLNFISKSAFERKNAQLNYRVYLNGNKEDMHAQPTPGPGQASTYKVRPNVDFDYTLPVNDHFGLVITGLSSNQFVEQHRWQPTWNYAQVGATPANPYLQQWQLQDGPKQTTRDSVAIKADFKLAGNQKVSLAVQNNFYHSLFGNRNLNFNMGTTATPTPVTGTALLWGPDFTQAATGRGSVTQGSSFRDKYGNTQAINLNYTLSTGAWDVEAGANEANSRTWYRALGRGHFANVGTSLQGVANLRADNILFPNLSWVARNAAGTVIDPYNLGNYRITTATNDPIDGQATMKSVHANAERHFDGWKIPISVKAGFDVREESRDNRRYSESYTYVGPDGVANTADDVASRYIDPNYSNEDPYWGYPKIQWIDAYQLGNAYAVNPALFTTNAVTNETFRRNNSEKITERITAAYLQFEGKLIDGHLRFVGGVRFEKTNDDGEGVLSNADAVWQRNPDGSYVDSNLVLAGVQRIRRTDAGAVGSMQELNLIRIERGFHASRSYDGLYPSLHLTYNFTDNFLARFAYSRTLGRPDYANIIPTTDINEDDSDPNAAGSISIRNTALKPWTADNYDLSLEYYFDKGGMISVGAFQKDLTGFWIARGGTVDAALADELGLEARYIGWGVTTTINGGSSAISGMEFNAERSLSFLPGPGRYFTVKANGTMIHLTGDNSPDFRAFISKAANFSLSYNKRPFSGNVNFNYRGRQKGTVITAPALQTGAQYGATTGFYEYYAPRWNVDVSGEYKVSERFSFFASARNILNKEQIIERFSAASAPYAKGFRQEEFGVNISAGLKGTF